MSIPHKVCLHCGREFAWRKKWERNWNEVKYCSDHCRQEKKKSSVDYKTKILELLNSREGTICPSEVLSMDQKKDKVLMEEVRRQARLLVHEGLIEITQKGQVVDPTEFKGPIRLRLKKGPRIN